MKNEQILKKAIEKAVKGGYKRWWTSAINANNIGNLNTYRIIFSHDFARAFWGEEKIISQFNNGERTWAWQHHLMEMVLEKEPIKYLEKYLQKITMKNKLKILSPRQTAEELAKIQDEVVDGEIEQELLNEREPDLDAIAESKHEMEEETK